MASTVVQFRRQELQSFQVCSRTDRAGSGSKNSVTSRKCAEANDFMAGGPQHQVRVSIQNPTYRIKVDFKLLVAVTILVVVVTLTGSLYQFDELLVVAVQLRPVDDVVDEVQFTCR